MTKQDRAAARRLLADDSITDAGGYLKSALDALDAMDACIRRLLKCGFEMDVWCNARERDNSDWQVAVADAERELGGTP